MENKRALMEKVLNKEPVERVPFAFWYHFASPPGPRPDLFRALEDEAVYQRVIQGHRDMYEKMQPDFMKLMSDGFFGHPSLRELTIERAEDLYQVKAVGADHPWITEQVKFVKQLNDEYHDEVFTFYSIFSPVNTIRLHFQTYEGQREKFPTLFLENPEAMAHAAREIAKDTKLLIQKLYEAVELDGLYYSVQEVQDDRADREFHERYVHRTDLGVLEEIKRHSPHNILHICGYHEYTNDLRLFKAYDLSIINWATHTEQVSLQEGQDFFGNKVVIGGFNNNPGEILDAGTDEEVAAAVHELLTDQNTIGLMLGADCTVNPDISAERYALIKALGKQY